MAIPMSETHDKLYDLLEDFDAAMLVTNTTAGELRSRPMALADVEPDGTLWFLTQSDSGKMDEIAHVARVNVAMQSKFKFVSISGTGRSVRDRAKLDAIWNEAWKTWFPGGKEDPKLVLLQVTANSGEYWDNSGSSGLKYLIEAGKAYLSGTRPDVEHDPKIHGKVEL
jgi:general stress protein 26